MSCATRVNHNTASDTLAIKDRITYGPHLKPGRVLAIHNDKLVIELDEGQIVHARRQSVHYTPNEATIMARALAVRKKRFGSVHFLDEADL